MNPPRPNGRNLGQDARMVMHEDEYGILKQILRRALGDDACLAMVVSDERSDARRAEDRLVLARFLGRMERQFALRAEERTAGRGPAPGRDGGTPMPSKRPLRRERTRPE